MNIVFQSSGVLGDGKYLAGQYAWPVAQRLGRAVLECVPPSAGVLTLELEVDGVGTGISFTVPALQEWARVPRRWRQGQMIGLQVAAGAVVRWRASFDGATEEAASQMSVSVAVGPWGMAGAFGPVAALGVEYLGAGRSSGPLVYEWLVAGGEWQAGAGASALGVAVALAGGITVDQSDVTMDQTDLTVDQMAGVLTFTIGGATVLRTITSSGVVQAVAFQEGGSGSLFNRNLPCLRFRIGEMTAGRVNVEGLWVARLSEVAGGLISAAESLYFDFGGGVRMGTKGMEASAFEEVQ